MTTRSDIDTEALIDIIGALQESLEDIQERLGPLRLELQQRMEIDGATEVPHQEMEVRLKLGSVDWEVSTLQPLLETLTLEWVEKIYTPPTQKVVDVSAKWNGTALNEAERKLGGEVSQRIRDARTRGRSTLVVRKKEKP
jgi:DNA replication initiation complex subunit (GINS family)